MSKIPAELTTNRQSVFSKTVSESDVYGFAGITGDFSANHVNAQIAAGTPSGKRIAHGVLTLGLASTAATLLVAETGSPAVSYGYDRVRFVNPVLFGDTITVTYRISALDHDRHESRASVTAVNQHGATVLVAEHILRFMGEAPACS